MQTEELANRGIDKWLVEQLRSWGIAELTDIQRLAIESGLADGKSMVVVAPTSSGKTLVGEIAVACGLRKSLRSVYLVSHKALADQKYEDFQRRFGAEARSPLASVGLSTGDRDEGDADAQLLIATYEKALALVLSGDLDTRGSIIIADELQILGEPGRGPDIEVLCSVIRQKGSAQFVALTATIENPRDLSGWLNCELVTSQTRDVPLHQEIWADGEAYRVTFGQDIGKKIRSKTPYPASPLEVVTRLLELDRGPVLVFTETRGEASKLAKAYSASRGRTPDGIKVAEQLDLFSEPTESSEQLRSNAERKVVFHSADLTPQERQVIEQGFVDAKFDVCFATSTLAAGVNFPFRAVVFPKLTYSYGDRQGTHIRRSDYRNMSGRAGRLGLHHEGFAILVPKNSVEHEYANKLVLPENDRINSQLVTISMRKTVLMLVSSGLVAEKDALHNFFENTLYWYQTLDRNKARLAEVTATSDKALEWLIERRFVERHDKTLLATPFGKAASASGLLPSTAFEFSEMLSRKRLMLEEDFDDYAAGILHFACCSEELQGETRTRFLPYTTGHSPGSISFVAARKLLRPLDRTNDQVGQCVHALVLFVEGEVERKIAFMSKVSSGSLHRLAIDIAWVLDGYHRLLCCPELGCSQQLANRISMLARRVRWGAPAEALDVIRVAERHGVPGFGRQRAMALLSQGISTLDDILNATKEQLSEILRNEHRALALVRAVSGALGFGPNRFAALHRRIAKELGIEQIVEDCDMKLGTDYERAVKRLLEVETSWVVTLLDDGKRQNVPDLMLTHGKGSILIECKTCTKTPALVNKEEAFAVLQKAVDFDKSMRRVTIGKPDFDEHSKSKAQASSEVTLVQHSSFVEVLLRLHAGTLKPEQVFSWLATPGVAEPQRLPGKARERILGVKNAKGNS
jgi:helicase